MKFNKYLIACVCAFTAAAHAENNWYVLGSIGQSNFDASNSDVNDALSPYWHAAEISIDKTDTAYKLQAGYQFTENFSIEGGYVDLGNLKYQFVPTPNPGTIALYYPDLSKVKVSASGWNLSAVGVLPLNNNFSLYAKAGAIRATVKAKTEVTYFFPPTGDSSDTESSTDIKPLFGVGASYKLNSNVSVRVEAERYSNLGDSDTTGEGNVDLYSAGIAYKF